MTSQPFDRSVILCAALLATQAHGQFDIETKIAASDAEAGDRFGSHVAIIGDTAIVGARRKDLLITTNQIACSARLLVGSTPGVVMNRK